MGCWRVGFGDGQAFDGGYLWPDPTDASASNDSRSPVGGMDAGAWDAGAWDAGAWDAGPQDASVRDAGTGPRDAGAWDAGSRDAGSRADAGADAGAVSLPVDDAVAFYAFDEGGGDTVLDRSTVGPPLDLLIEDFRATAWRPNGLEVLTETRLISLSQASKVVTRALAARAISVEAWVTPRELDGGARNGPARIVTLAVDDDVDAAFTLGQGDAFGASRSVLPQWCFRIRTSMPWSYGEGPTTPLGTLTLAPHHVVATSEVNGPTRVYVDGNLEASELHRGAWTWPEGRLAVANDVFSSRYFLGTLHQVAIFARAMGPAEVEARFDAQAGRF